MLNPLQDYDPVVMEEFTKILEKVQVDGGTVDAVRRLAQTGMLGLRLWSTICDI